MDSIVNDACRCDSQLVEGLLCDWRALPCLVSWLFLPIMAADGILAAMSEILAVGMCGTVVLRFSIYRYCAKD